MVEGLYCRGAKSDIDVRFGANRETALMSVPKGLSVIWRGSGARLQGVRRSPEGGPSLA